MKCEDITFSTINRLNNFACACNPNYAWDSFTFTCVPFTGTIALTTSSYVVCTSIPYTVGTNLINTAASTGSKDKGGKGNDGKGNDGKGNGGSGSGSGSGSTTPTFIQLSDDDVFAIANSVNPLYKAESKFVCKCEEGYLWSDIRKRCYILAMNNNF